MSIALLGAAPQDAGLELLRRAVSARGARYVATRRVEVREGGARKIHEERLVRDGHRLRIQFSPGSRYEGQTVIEIPEGRFILDPARREIRKLPARGDEGERRLGRFLRMIRDGQMVLTYGDGGKIAGVPTRRLVLARDGQPFLALSIEPRSAVVLKRENFDPEGRSVGVYEFTRFEPRPKIDGNNFVLPKAGYRLVSPLDDLRALARGEGITVATLSSSSGYRLEGSRVRRTGAGTIIAAFYSGGGKRLTLFASRGELPDLSARGTGSRTSAPGVSLYRWRVGTTSYGLLGEESPARLRALAGMLTP